MQPGFLLREKTGLRATLIKSRGYNMHHSSVYYEWFPPYLLVHVTNLLGDDQTFGKGGEKFGAAS